MRAVPNRFVSLVSVMALTAVAFVACSDATAPAPEPEPTPEAAVYPTASLASGAEGGTYHGRYAKELDAGVLDWTLAARTTAGSTENLDLLAQGEVDLALAQADVFAARIAEEPQVFAGLKIVALLAEECVFVAYRKESSIDAFADLAENVGEREALISIGPENGGMAETWNYLSSVLPEQSNAEIDYSSGEAGLGKLVQGDVDAVAWITDPRNARHSQLMIVQSNPDLGLLDVADDRLFDVLAGETDVYLPRELPVSDGDRQSIATVCTPALLVVGPNSPEGLVESLRAAGFGT